MIKWWFKRHPRLYSLIRKQLTSNPNYSQKKEVRDNVFISYGEIIVRYEGSHRFPILIVFPDSTPYALPSVYLLNPEEELSDEFIDDLGKTDINRIGAAIKKYVRFYYRRHQNFDGSLCILEGDNLDVGAAFYNIQSILGRITSWFKGLMTGEMPLDNNEVEPYAHFPVQNSRENFLYTEEFLFDNYKQGEFCGSIITAIPYGETHFKLYVSSLLLLIDDKGMFQNAIPKNPRITLPEIFDNAVNFYANRTALLKCCEEGKMLTGLWFETEIEPDPFEGIEGLVNLIGNNDISIGYDRLFMFKEFFQNYLKALPGSFYVGIRYLNRRNEKEWALFKLHKVAAPAALLIVDSLNDIKACLNNYSEIQAIHTEKFTDQSFHVRNTGRADRDILYDVSIAILGAGSLGSEVADSLAKAGVGNLHIVDNQRFHTHNAVRHVLGIESTGMPKVDALIEKLRTHNPFINITGQSESVLRCDIPGNTVSISTIADDNTEAFINEKALSEQQAVFYARALRGGKAARIFRVIPGGDACFHCLKLYRTEGNPLFIQIPEDSELPTLANECNNPIRPASSSDLKLISALTSRLVLDHIQQKGREDKNHWIWLSDDINEQLSVSSSVPFLLNASFLPPHNDCPLCNPPKIESIVIDENCVLKMQTEIKEDKQVETGGILVGEFVDGVVKVRHVSGPGPKAVKTPTKFIRDSEYCQQFLDSFTGKYDYVGEWHFHPSSSGTPSRTDIESLSGIASQKEYLIIQPISIIVTNDEQLWGTIHYPDKQYDNLDITVKNLN